MLKSNLEEICEKTTGNLSLSLDRGKCGLEYLVSIQGQQRRYSVHADS